MPTKKLKNRIKEFREKKNLSQRALADLLKTSQQQVHRWENGQAINFEMAIVLARVLGQRPEVVFPAFKNISIKKEDFEQSEQRSKAIQKAVEKAGFETKAPRRWYLRLELRGFKEPFIYKVDEDEANSVRGFLINSNSTNEGYNFKLFDTSDGLSVAVKSTELTCCQILFDFVDPSYEVLVAKKEQIEKLDQGTLNPEVDDLDDEIDDEDENSELLKIFTVNNDKTYMLSDLSNEDVADLMADLDNGWYQDNPYSYLVDEDGEDFLIRNEHIALVQVPTSWYHGAYDEESGE